MRLLQFVTRCISHHSFAPQCVTRVIPIHRTIYDTHNCDFPNNWLMSNGWMTRTQHYCTATHPMYQSPRNKRPQLHASKPDNCNTSTDVQDSMEEDFGKLSQKYSSRTVFKKTSPNLQHLRHVDDEIEKEEEPSMHKSFKKNTPYWYFLQCKRKIKEGKLAEALDLFEIKMLKEERLQPEESNYTVLIGGCGRAGYVKKAFSLYSDMKKRRLEPLDATYTALFNACAESPWKDSGLQHALKLRQELREKNVQLNLIAYQSLMKVCALCSDMPNTLEIFKEIVQKGHIVTTDTFNILLMSCIKDTTAGFRYSLQVWRQMVRLGLKPNINTYNLLLRSVKDCGIGDPGVAFNVLLRSKENVPLKLKGRIGKHKQTAKDSMARRLTEQEVEMLQQQMLLESPKGLNPTGLDVFGTNDPAVIKQMSSLLPNEIVPLHTETMPLDTSRHLPNLLKPNVDLTNVVSLGSVLNSSDRLALIGDMEGILQMMQEDQVCPNIKTFTLFADVTEPDSQSESSLINLMDSLQIQVDVTFLNTLVKKRSEMLNLKSAKELLPVFVKRGIAPNIQTFSNLANACYKKEDGLQLLEDMTISGVLPNNYVYSTLIKVAVKRLDYIYLTDILRDMNRRNIAPNEVVIRQLEFAAQYPPKFDRYKGKNVFLERIDGFRGYYNRWLGWMAAEETPHPWEKYRTRKEQVSPKDEK
ncbi:pentatricopeptide repeat-containing protein 1, mitochondrial [Pelodytes ibericus]